MSKEIKSLTGLRGVAACFVVLYHLGDHHIGRGLARQFIEHGYLWVDLFFSLSGFVLALTYAKNFLVCFKVSTVRKYTLDRIARIFPMFWFVTLYEFAREHVTSRMASAAHLVTINLPLPPSWLTLVLNLLLIQTWGLGESIVGPGWSLSTEWAVSLIFPLLVLVAGRRDGPGFWGALAVSLMSLAWLDLMPSSISGAVGVRGPMDMSNGTSYAPMLRCFADFTLGVVALRLSNEKRVQRIAAQSMTSLFLAVAIIGLLCLPGTDLAIMLLFPIFIVSISFGAPFIARVLGSAPLHHVGKISYSLYLIHTLLIPYDHKIVRLLTRLRIPAPIDIGLVLSILLAIGVATLTYRWIEVLGRMILRRGFARWRDVPVINPALAPPTNV